MASIRRPSGPFSGPAINSNRPRKPGQRRERRWEFLAERPRSFRENGYLFVHGSARNPLNEYVFPEDIYNQRKMERIFALVETLLLSGPYPCAGRLHRADARRSVSVQQPRRDRLLPSARWPQDAVQRRLGRPAARRRLAACYILLDGDTIRYRRVEYDFDTTVKKIYAVPELENFLGDRLRDGRCDIKKQGRETKDQCTSFVPVPFSVLTSHHAATEISPVHPLVASSFSSAGSSWRCVLWPKYFPRQNGASRKRATGREAAGQIGLNQAFADRKADNSGRRRQGRSRSAGRLGYRAAPSPGLRRRGNWIRWAAGSRIRSFTFRSSSTRWGPACGACCSTSSRRPTI